MIQGSGQTFARIINDDLPPTVNIVGSRSSENADFLEFSVSRAGDMTDALTANVETAIAAAGSAKDAGAVTTPSDAPEIDRGLGVVARTAEIIEGDDGVQAVSCAVFRTGDTSEALEVEYVVGGDVDAADLACPSSGPISFAADETARLVEIGLAGDTEFENNEDLTFSIVPADAGVFILNDSADVETVINSLTEVAGTNQSDELEGTSDAVPIGAKNGDDDVRARAGDDVIDAGRGDDTVRAGSGDDQVNGGQCKDELRGGTGNDRLLGGSESDSLKVSDGDDILIGGDGNDRLSGGSGRDFFDAEDTGFDRINDFENGINMVVLTGFAPDARPSVRQSGANAVLEIDSAKIVEFRRTDAEGIDSSVFIIEDDGFFGSILGVPLRDPLRAGDAGHR